MSIGKKQELFGIKLKHAILIRKKANKTTPSPTWKLGFSNSSSPDPHFSMKSSASARKIGANLWEVQPQFNFNKDDGDRDDDGGGDVDGDGDHGGLIHHSRRHHYEKKGFEISDQLDEEPFDSDPQTPEIKTSLRKNIKNLRHLSIGKNEDLQHVSSASCCSSMQVTPYGCAITPTSYTLKTSTHLLKVLNRIWNLEEQHSSNVASIQALKRELDISRAQIKTLIEERKNDHQEISELRKSTHEKKKKNAFQSTKDEISDMKSSLSREKKARILLESLCDEFAKGIRVYEQKVRSLQRNRGRKDEIEPDRLILHVSEAWLDERAQMKCDSSENTSISDNLCCEIETFLEAKKKQSRGSRVEDYPEPSSRGVSKMVDSGHRAGEPSSKSMSRRTDQGQAREGVKSNTLMAKLLEARLESKLLKSRIRR
ncbi:hypothetical protein L1887_41825 [Cichorium endivia]|nr:hypothetical protein L1887_41825 [Cichorium endivia]